MLLAVWLVWFARSEVSVVETTADARLERAAVPRPIDAPLAGRVVSSHLVLGKRVTAGESAEDDMRASDAVAGLEELTQRAARLEGDLAVQRKKGARLEYEVDRNVITAPVTGEIASTEELAVGAVVREGAPLAVILPDGEVRIVAQFSPQAAFGRLRPGQAAAPA